MSDIHSLLVRSITALRFSRDACGTGMTGRAVKELIADLDAALMGWDERATPTGEGGRAVTEADLQRALDSYSETFLARSEKYDADAHMKAMRAALEAAGGGDGWVACSERMPPLASLDQYQTWDGEYQDIEWVNWLSNGGRGAFCRNNRPAVTHWRPLPLPPAPLVGGVQ